MISRLSKQKFYVLTLDLRLQCKICNREMKMRGTGKKFIIYIINKLLFILFTKIHLSL